MEETIEKYLLGLMSSEEKEAFEVQMKNNDFLKREVQVQKDIVEATRINGLKANISKANKSFKTAKLIKKVVLATAITAAVGVGLYYGLKKGNTNANSNNHNEPIESIIERSESQDNIDLNSQEPFSQTSEFLIQENGVMEGSNKELKKNSFEIPDGFKQKFTEVLINPNKPNSIKLDKDGSILHIPAYAFQYANGEDVHALVTIKYREYKNSAEMAFSGIPMVYKKNGIEYNFNSSGMFEILGYEEDKPISIKSKKSLTIDYNLAKQNRDIDFYRLKKDKSNWMKIQNIEETSAESKLLKDTIGDIEMGFQTNRIEIVRGRKSWLRRNNKNKDGLAQDVGQENRNGKETVLNIPKKSGEMLGSGMGAGHTYPKIIRGLSIGQFGVYNCDQIYRIKNRVTIKPLFTDENGDKIEGAVVLSLIDLNYNGAFSWSPQSFVCNRKGENALALFTKNGKLFLLSPEDFQKVGITNSGNYTFQMENVTNEIRNTQELQVYLGIQ